MARATFLAGITGGIVGSIAAIIGVIWCIYSTLFLMNYSHYTVDIAMYAYYFGAIIPIMGYYVIFAASGMYAILPIHSINASLSMWTMILGIFLVASSILIGIGFFGMYRASGNSMGVVGLITSIAGSSVGSLLIYLGVISQQLQTPYSITYGIIIFIIFPIVFFVQPIYIPNLLYLWLGLTVLGVTFILLGVCTISLSKHTGNVSASKAAGALSIVGGILLFPYILVWLRLYDTVGSATALIGFLVILITFILWAAVYYSSRKM
nr:hypothetical protein [Candidatus Freyarchaeota archaeon]